MQGIDYVCDRKVRWEAKQVEVSSNRKQDCPTLKGTRRGGGVTGTEDYPGEADVREEAHLLPEMSPEAGGGEMLQLLPASCLPASQRCLPLATLSQNLAGKEAFRKQPFCITEAEQEKSKKGMTDRPGTGTKDKSSLPKELLLKEILFQDTVLQSPRPCHYDWSMKYPRKSQILQEVGPMGQVTQLLSLQPPTL